ncbi:hypothetical protein CPB84DRAFT_1808184 [Gymnopilus junonius]|uniref:Uncharacterized protein n=1 Tax=Gymnopilus junonius TaxID=109634 RepID=A0A9P5N743_GYMJU|nr:hypothetical protein CPB84DRAFT_1808184 [Gymnopilus junonius]
MFLIKNDLPVHIALAHMQLLLCTPFVTLALFNNFFSPAGVETLPIIWRTRPRMALQVFQYRNHGREFRAVTDATVIFQTKQFLIIPSFQFLCLLDAKIPDNTLNGSFIEMPDLDLEHFRALKDANEQIVAALKLSRKRKVEGLDLEE